MAMVCWQNCYKCAQAVLNAVHQNRISGQKKILLLRFGNAVDLQMLKDNRHNYTWKSAITCYSEIKKGRKESCGFQE